MLLTRIQSKSSLRNNFSRFFGYLLMQLVVMMALGTIPLSNAALSPTFNIKTKIQLCPEYKLGNTELLALFRLEGETEYRDAEIINETINTANTEAELVIALPSHFAKRNLHISAVCENNFGESLVSNEITTNNCESLATIDTDFDGLKNSEEDTNCDNFYSPGDSSNPDNLDSDGDGIRDFTEFLDSTDANNPGSSTRAKIFSGRSFDPDGDGNSNPVAFRPSNGTWYIKGFIEPQNNIAIGWGLPGDIPFTYNSKSNGLSNVGVIRLVNGEYQWFFNGPGLLNQNGVLENNFLFGLFGDNIILGPWEDPEQTTPAIARLFNGTWYFYFRQKNGSIKTSIWGGNGDIPAVSDYDGDGLFDVAVYRPSTSTLFSINSSDGQVQTLNFGTFTSEFSFRGDVTGDGKDDLTFWEPITATFETLKSDEGFNSVRARLLDPRYYLEFPLGIYFEHLPLSWNRQNGVELFTVINHRTGWRYFRPRNNANFPEMSIQWGLDGDALG